MDYELTDAHKLIRDTAKRIAKEKVAPRAAEMDESGEYPHDIFDAFAEAGLLGLTIPEQYGGSGAGFMALALAVEETAKYCNSSALILLLSALSTQPINLGGSEEQKHEWLSKSATGAIKGVLPDGTEQRLGRRRPRVARRARRRRLHHRRREDVHLWRLRRSLRLLFREERAEWLEVDLGLHHTD